MLLYFIYIYLLHCDVRYVFWYLLCEKMSYTISQHVFSLQSVTVKRAVIMSEFDFESVSISSFLVINTLLPGT